jgi:hypothetical protein
MKLMLEEAKRNYSEVMNDVDNFADDSAHYTLDSKCKTLFHHMLYAKALILREKFTEAEPILHISFSLVKSIKLNRREIIRNTNNEKVDNKNDAFDEQSKGGVTGVSTKQKFQNAVFYKMVMTTYGTIAALFSHIGNQKMAEEVYETYARIVEKHYGNNSLESSS